MPATTAQCKSHASSHLGSNSMICKGYVLTIVEPYFGHGFVAKLCARYLKTLFSCPEIPLSSTASSTRTPSLVYFIAYALYLARLPSSVIFYALHLLLFQASSSHRLFLAAFIITSKLTCDSSYTLKSWYYIAQRIFTLHNIDQMEREMCCDLNWHFRINPKDLTAFELIVHRHYGYIWPSPDNEGYEDDNALNTQPALISHSLNTKKRPLGDHDDPCPVKESKRSSLDDDNDNDNDNDDYDCSSSPTPGPPKSTTATEPSPLPKEEPEEEPKHSKPKPIPQPDPKLKQEPIDKPKEDEDELEPLPPSLIPEINRELAAAKSMRNTNEPRLNRSQTDKPKAGPLNKLIAQLDTAELVTSGLSESRCHHCSWTVTFAIALDNIPPPPRAPVMSEPPHVVRIDASAPQEGPQVIRITAPPAPAPAPVVAAPVVSEPPHVIHIGGSAPQEGPQVICVTSPPVPTPVVAAPATSEPLNVICIGDSAPQEGPQVIRVICITSPQPIVAPAP
ncbi:hypothetical protein FRC11_000638 [Ceratobasidium sp. 423]|nr:hypothetical protein FRC11_000638 [Ceratobasidium sp. 423]